MSDHLLTNYDVYLQRMTDSTAISSKGLIPNLVKGKTLDVGCGSGVLLEKLSNAIGIDTDLRAVDLCRNKGLNVFNTSLYNLNENYDTIIFSSVLHEFSSYDETDAFTDIPIKKALNKAYELLNHKGQIIIRDGVKANQSITMVKPKNIEILVDLNQYLQDTPIKFENYTFDHNSIIGTSNMLKEFMYTYTWGKESYSREVKEQYGILTKDEWINVIGECGFTITGLNTYPEEYTKYLSKYFELDNNLVNLFKESTILITAEKR